MGKRRVWALTIIVSTASTLINVGIVIPVPLVWHTFGVNWVESGTFEGGFSQ